MSFQSQRSHLRDLHNCFTGKFTIYYIFILFIHTMQSFKQYVRPMSNFFLVTSDTNVHAWLQELILATELWFQFSTWTLRSAPSTMVHEQIAICSILLCYKLQFIRIWVYLTENTFESFGIRVISVQSNLTHWSVGPIVALNPFQLCCGFIHIVYNILGKTTRYWQ